MFGAVTFALSILILIFDLIGFVRNKFDFKSLQDGKAEGWTLVAFVLWWVVGVISITRAGAIGYAALNIYFSAWASLFASLHALNKWGGEKDILTFRELTRLSLTLSSWWIVFWASIITLGSAADSSRLANTQDVRQSCSFAIAVSTFTSVISGFFVLSHYEFLQCCRACATWLSYGGWFELACSVVVNIFLVIGLDQLTSAGKIGSTIDGNGDSDIKSEDYVPGSNIYVAIWTAFIASVYVTMKWKEASALGFLDKEVEEEIDDDAKDEDTEIVVTDNSNDGEGGI